MAEKKVDEYKELLQSYPSLSLDQEAFLELTERVEALEGKKRKSGASKKKK